MDGLETTPLPAPVPSAPVRDSVRFLFGGEARELRDVDPTMTVLDWLRLAERRTGTKEGCAEGDCGACTVVVGRLDGDRLRYEAVNACIRFLPTLDGCHLLTVEHLKSRDGALHPVQRALVETSGSQCGFCTPGFVMSLYALYRDGERPDEGRVDDALAGNLCRCTGYKPIVEAALRMHDIEDRADRPDLGDEGTADRLRALRDEATVSVGTPGRRFHAPATIEALAALLEERPAARIVAGATDVGLWVTKQMSVLDEVVHLGRVEALRRIEEDADGSLRIGAAATYTEAAEPVARLYPDLGELIRRIGSVQIRNAGTIGGNIANGSPIGDMPPALIAAGAAIVLNRGGRRRTLPLEDFFIDYGKQDRAPGEFVETVILPAPAPGTRFRAYKISKRFDQDISAVCGAFAIRVENGLVAEARLAYGGMAAVPKRARNAEAALLGRPWTEETVGAAMDALSRDFAPLTDWRASAEYRLRVAANLLLKLHAETTDPDAGTRLVGDRNLAHV
jgi:xanthine dehydrogenase small subunit